VEKIRYEGAMEEYRRKVTTWVDRKATHSLSPRHR
jgi:hypothetical protein